MQTIRRLLFGMTLYTVLSATCGLFAQAIYEPVSDTQSAGTASAPTEFDVVSVKPNTSASGLRMIAFNPGMFTANGATLKMLIEQAYGIRKDLIIGGPGWINSSSFDMEGKISAEDVKTLSAMNKDQLITVQQLMIQHALADRFKLKIHMETKMVAIYELVLAKDGSKLKEAAPNSSPTDVANGPGGVSNQVSVSTRGPNSAGSAPNVNPGSGSNSVPMLGRGRFKGSSTTVAALVKFLAGKTERTVIDKTGLTGTYDILLIFTLEDNSGGTNSAASDSNTPDLFTAIQEQLGLKLVSAKGPVDSLVINSAEKPDSN